jgi:hypothetical protein
MEEKFKGESYVNLLGLSSKILFSGHINVE